MDLENSIEEDIEKKISWKKRINLRNHEKYQRESGDADSKMRDMAASIQTIR